LIIIILRARARDCKGKIFIVGVYMTYMTSDKNDFSKSKENPIIGVPYDLYDQADLMNLPICPKY